MRGGAAPRHHDQSPRVKVELFESSGLRTTFDEEAFNPRQQRLAITVLGKSKLASEERELLLRYGRKSLEMMAESAAHLISGREITLV